MTAAHDRREHVRHNISVACQISFGGNKLFTATTRNVSLGGAKIIMESMPTDLAKGTPCQLTLEPEQRNFKLNAIVMRVRDNSVALFFKILDKSAEQQLAQFLGDHSDLPA